MYIYDFESSLLYNSLLRPFKVYPTTTGELLRCPLSPSPYPARCSRLPTHASLETSTLVDPASPSPFMKHIPAYAPCETAADASGADWETRLLVHRASLANLRRAAVDPERRSWVQVPREM